jgi:hypothetical protein
MSTTTDSSNVRISPRSKAVLRQMATREGKAMQAVLDEAIEQYRRSQFFQDLDASFAKLQAKPEDWESEESERQSWDSSLGDGLEVE